MMKLLALFACLAVSIASVAAVVPADEIKSLPGWTGPLPSKHYSGYFSTSLNGTVAGQLHYWLTLSESNPKTDPLVLWLQGGPGCSSLFGLFYENGQLHFSGEYDDKKLPLIVRNPYAWTKSANMIWLEQPIGVGFSYCVPGATGDCSGNNFGLDAYNFFVNFFKGFPELADNDFHISGESYGGVYCPYVADAIVTGNNQGGNKHVNLKGMLVGNGLGGEADNTEQMRREADFFYGHAAYSFQKHISVEQMCDWNATQPSQDCMNAVMNAEATIGHYYVYNFYDTCPHDLNAKKPSRVALRDADGINAPLFAPINKYTNKVLKELGFVCVLESMSQDYLNNADVQKAIHVTVANVSNWGPCGNGAEDQNGESQKLLAGHRAHMSEINMMQPNDDLGALYVKLIGLMPVLIYSGDVDQCVPTYYSDNWTRRLGYPVDFESLWMPWTYGPDDNIQVGGYATQYKGAGKNLTFLTVRDAGHMVPQYASEAALTMLQLYLANAGYIAPTHQQHKSSASTF